MPRPTPSAPAPAPRDDRGYDRNARPAPQSADRDGRAYGRTAPGVRQGPSARPYDYPRDDSRYGYGRAVPRPSPPYDYPRVYGGRNYGYAPRVLVPVRPYYRPYYSFRPRFSLSVGLFVGYPVPYPYSFGYPTYVYGAYPYTPDYYGSQSVPYAGVIPTQGSYGGISFDITPSDADVYVDGAYVGRVGDFSPMYQPLTMTPGRHQVELDAPGCEPLVFDVDIIAGQVLPYRGALQPY